VNTQYVFKRKATEGKECASLVANLYLTTKCKRTNITNVKEGTLNCIGARHAISYKTK